MLQVRNNVQPLGIAFSSLAFPTQPLEEVAALGASWGYDGIELRVIDGELIDPAMSPAERARVSRVLEREGLAVVAVDSSIRLTEAGADAAIGSFLDLAEAWGAPLVRVFGGGLPAEPAARAERLAAAAGVLRAASGRAERLGVGIGIETHDDFSSSAVVAEVLAEVPSPFVGAVWDSHHPWRMGETAELTHANLGDRLLLAQVKDARRSAAHEGGWELVLLGEGEVPVREMVALLGAGGYAGVLSVEWEKRWHPEIAEPEVALPQHLELLRAWVGGSSRSVGGT